MKQALTSVSKMVVTGLPLSVAVLATAQIFGSTFGRGEPKFGLWEFTDSISYPDAGRSAPLLNRTTRARVCVTTSTIALTWLGQTSNFCTPLNSSRERGHITMDLTCPGMSGHVDTHIISPEHTHSVTRMMVSQQDHTKTFSNSIVDAHLVSSSCGSIQPGQPLVVR